MRIHFDLVADSGEILDRVAYDVPPVVIDPRLAADRQTKRAERKARLAARAEHMSALRPQLRAIATELSHATQVQTNARQLRQADPWRTVEENKKRVDQLRRALLAARKTF